MSKLLTLSINRVRKVPQWTFEIANVLPWFLAGREPKVLVTSMDLAQVEIIRGLYGARPIFFSRLFPLKADFILGWGLKMSGKRVTKLRSKAKQSHLLEDGFLRSVKRYGASCSLVIDDEGIFYDPNSKSRLFDLIQEPLKEAEIERAIKLAEAWRENRVSKYNDSPDFSGELPTDYVLVIDQVAQDLSVKYASEGKADFDRMLKTALAENPDKTIVIKSHPDSAKDASKSHFDWSEVSKNSRIRVIRDTCHIVSLIENASSVYTVCSQVGFEALIWNVPVKCFGSPFYSGLGLTEDYTSRPAPTKGPVALHQLILAALKKYSLYWNPVTKSECEPEEIISLLGASRAHLQRPRSTIYAFGFSRWKRNFIQGFLAEYDVQFVKRWSEVPTNAEVVVWGRTPVPSSRNDLLIKRIEDGFIRSSGLGADLIKPYSLVLDDMGLYFDSTRPSRIQNILNTCELTEEDLEKARQIRFALIESRINKYNLGGQAWSRPDSSKKVLLIAGQVESDASIRFGSPKTKTNSSLIEQVREKNSDAYLVYKPHPDVVAGLRKSDDSLQTAKRLCDEIVFDADSISMIEEVDEIHTITSLLGFEALIRGKKVVCYGQPFYSGWGLTTDICPNPDRTRTANLDELVHSAIIAYPRYYDCNVEMFLPAGLAIEKVAQEAELGPKSLNWKRKVLRSILAAYNQMIKKA